ncbi:MAG: hypothetical protein ACE5H4_07335 [Candidatus Thorarchaeota archaeon]
MSLNPKRLEKPKTQSAEGLWILPQVQRIHARVSATQERGQD